MNTLPLAKREIHLLKWVTLFVLMAEMVILVGFDNVMTGRLGGWSIMTLSYNSHSHTPFFERLPNTSFLTLAVMVLAFVQFYGINQMFLFSLPIRKNSLLRMKLLTGVCSYTLWILIYGAGIMAIFMNNQYWFDQLSVYLPEYMYLEILQHSGIGVILQYLLLLWLALTAMYFLCVFFQITLKNKIAAGILSFSALWYPAFLYGNLSSGLSQFFTNNHLWFENHFEKFYNMAANIQLFSLPEISDFSYAPARHSFESFVDGQSELGRTPTFYVLDHIAFKLLLTVAVAAIFTWFAFRYFSSGRTNDKKIMKRFMVTGALAVSLLILCNLLPYIKLNREAVDRGEIYRDFSEIPINLEKTADTKKLNAYVKLNDFVSEFTMYSSNEEWEDTRRKVFALFNLETLGYYNISKTSGLDFSFEADDFLSRTDIPSVLEQEGFQGLKAFITRSEQQFQETTVPQQSNLITYPYYYYDENAKAFVVYNITAHSYRQEPSSVSLSILFRATLSYPNKYMDSIQDLENENRYFSEYFVGGHKDMLVFENPDFIVHIAGDRYYNRQMNQTISEFPFKTWLYGKDGVVDSVKIAVVVPRDAVIENQELNSIDTFLALVNVTQNDKAKIKGEIQNALQEEPISKKNQQLEGCAYRLLTAIIQQDYKLVEVTVSPI